MKKSILLLFLLAVFIGADAKNYKVTADQLNVRSCASKNCKTVGSLQNGELVDVLEIVTSDNNEEWGKITLTSGEEGYVMLQYLVAEQVSGNGTEDKEDVNKVFGPFFYIGIGALVLFLIFFRISFKKKSFPIFVGKGDFVFVIIAAIAMGMLLISIDLEITSGEPLDSDSIICIIFFSVVFFIPYIISVILTLKKPLTSKQKLMSVLSKTLFIFSSVFLIVFILVVLGLFKKKKKIVVVDGVYREIEEDTKLWKKIKTYWKDMKNMSSQPTHIRMPIEDLNNDDDIDL